MQINKFTASRAHSAGPTLDEGTATFTVDSMRDAVASGITHTRASERARDCSAYRLVNKFSCAKFTFIMLSHLLYLPANPLKDFRCGEIIKQNLRFPFVASRATVANEFIIAKNYALHFPLPALPFVGAWRPASSAMSPAATITRP